MMTSRAILFCSVAILATSAVGASAPPPGSAIELENGFLLSGSTGPLTTISAGARNSLATTADGSLVMCGYVAWLNDLQALAAGPFTRFVAMNGFAGSIVGLRADGSVLRIHSSGQQEYPGPFVDVAIASSRMAGITPSGDLVWMMGSPMAGSPTRGSFTQVDLGSSTVGVAIATDGSLAAWGASLETEPEGTFVDISVGQTHAVALRSDGEAICWGDPADGRCDAPPGPFTAVSAGATFTIALRPDGSIAQWGAISSALPSGSFVAIDAGWGFAVALRADGTVAGWGRQPEGAHVAPGTPFVRCVSMDNNWFALRSDGSLEQFVVSPTAPFPAPSTPAMYQDLSSTPSVIAAIQANGTVSTRGFGLFGEETPPDGAFRRLSGGLFHFAAIDDLGQITCWGLNTWGQCDSPRGPFLSVAAGDYHTVALRSDGSVAAWGDNFYGQCDAPAGSYVEVSAGIGHSVALRADGSLSAWGRNVEGQCSVSGGPYTHAYAIGNATIAVAADGSVACFGSDTEYLCAFIQNLTWRFEPRFSLITPGPDCDADGTPDFAAIFDGAADANGDGVPDACSAPFDLDGDGLVAAGDLAILLGAWGAGGAADFDGSGHVGATDLALLLGAWSV